MTIVLENNPFIVSTTMEIPQNAIAGVCRLRLEGFVVGAGEKEYGNTFEAAEIGGVDEVEAEGLIGSDVTNRAHLFDEREERHVDAAKEA